MKKLAYLLFGLILLSAITAKHAQKNKQIEPFVSVNATYATNDTPKDLFKERVTLVSELLGAEDIKYLDGLDLSAQSSAYSNFIIETTATCFYAGVGDVRCMAGPEARIQVFDIDAENDLDDPERNCTTLSHAIRPQCRFRIRFKYGSFETLATSDGSYITLVKPVDGFALILDTRPKPSKNSHLLRPHR